MKFKYNYLTNTLRKIAGKYTYEFCDNSHFRTPYGTEGFHLGEQEWITFAFSPSNLQVNYQKENFIYQKTLSLPNLGEIIFEFTEQDRINSS